MLNSKSKAVIDIRWDEYQTQCRLATVTAMRKWAALVAKQVKADTPRSTKHRSLRKYPSGNYYDEPKNLYQTVYSRARKRKGTVYGLVSFKYGYVNMLIGRMKKQGRGNFMIEARDKRIDEGIRILREGWPK